MADSDLIDFELIENHKENIQALPSGRSAKALAALYSPPLTSALPQVQDIHSDRRADFEKELALIDEADDPLDIYDRYVKWTLDAYPSAQATPQSQLLPLLERATKAFLPSQQYKNDPRYLRLWLHYIRLFSDAQRETFVFLSRNAIGETLALYYEEFAAWLEQAGRWVQAEEVFRMGLEKEAQPTARLTRKFGEFQRRHDARPQDVAEPTSPALPPVRSALAAKIDPFAATATTSPAGESQQSTGRVGAGVSKKKANKLAIFSDDGPQEQSVLGAKESSNAWDSIESLSSRKKENSVEAKPWAGETLKTGKTNTGVPKMMVFKSSEHSSSAALPNTQTSQASNHASQRVVNPKTGRAECVFVNLEAVYPDPQNPAIEFCFEELRARHRGWLDRDWAAEKVLTASFHETPVTVEEAEEELVMLEELEQKPKKQRGFEIFEDECSLPAAVPETASLLEQPLVDVNVSVKALSLNDENDENKPPSRQDVDLARRLRREERANRTRKIKVMDVQHVKKETQTIQLNLASPTGPKIKRKRTAEPTMTINTREAMDEIYGIFSQPDETEEEPVEDEESDDDSDDDDYTSGGESTTTGKLSAAGSDYGDETRNELQLAQAAAEVEEQEGEERTEVTGWSDFTTSKHVPREDEAPDKFSDEVPDDETPKNNLQIFQDEGPEEQEDDLSTPQDEQLVTPMEGDGTARTRYVPLPPEDYEPMTAQFRNAGLAGQTRLPFMTPIVEQTESSLGVVTGRTEKDYFNSKTPCRQTPGVLEPFPDEEDDDGPWSSPFQEAEDEAIAEKRRILQPIRTKTTKGIVSFRNEPTKPKPLGRSIGPAVEVSSKGPIIQDQQCNPVDPELRQLVLSQVRPALSSYEGYHEHADTDFGRSNEIRKFAKAASKVSKTSTNLDKTASTLSPPPILSLPNTQSVYTIKRELGAGAFAPVYLVETSLAADDTDENDENATPARMGHGAFTSVHRHALEALKMEDSPASAWEFYMIRQTHRRLGVSRAAESIVHAHEMHLYRDAGLLIESYRDQGTLLDLVNTARADPGLNGGGGAAGGAMDEPLALFFAVELLRTVEALHRVGVVHGDIKADNVLVRLNKPCTLPSSSSSSSTTPSGSNEAAADLDAHYSPSGAHGWAAKGLTLIDFGRGIDMRAFSPTVQFVADWATTEADCAEMRELRPWTFHVDYHGLAGTLHSLLFGRYMAVVCDKGVGGGCGLGSGNAKTYRLREPLKRYWQTELWAPLFDLLLNPVAHVGREEGARLPVVRGLRECRERMEGWLEANCEKGVGLRVLVRRAEEAVARRRR